MNLVKALGLCGDEALAFIGAGGKTSALFALARELTPPVVLTTTTHLGAWQAALADEHRIIHAPEEIPTLIFNDHILLLTGPLGDEHRLMGLNDRALFNLQSRCKQRHIPLLIEADGARQRSVKAPASYEPCLPAWIKRVVVVVGLSALGKPLNDETVHRPEIFSSLSGLPIGEPITAQALSTVLGSDQGGLKGIPQGAQRILFLNQAEGTARKTKGENLARQLTKVYDRVLVGSLQQPGVDGTIFKAYGQTAGVILAAGGSERLGRPKQLLDWRGKPFIVQVVMNALEAGLEPVTVVTGAHQRAVAAVLDDLPVHVVTNPGWASGQASSMKVGMAALPERCDSVIFLLSDQPQIAPSLIRQLREKYAQTRAPIIAPIVGEQRGNPVLFGRETFDALSAVEGDQGGRAVFHQFELEFLPWFDSRILLDVDTEEDLTKLRQAYAQGLD